MINKIIYTILCLCLSSISTYADSWTPKIACGYQNEFVVDGFHTYQNGFANYQVVIRNLNAIKYLQSFLPNIYPQNINGEWIFTNLLFTQNVNGHLTLANQYTGEFRVEIMNSNSSSSYSSSGMKYLLFGHWLSNYQYEVSISEFSYYPGMTYHEPKFLGKWVFDNCRKGL